MDSVDKYVERKRKIRYKRLKKFFKARDMASKYINRVIRVSDLDKFFPDAEEDCFFTSDLAKVIIDSHWRIRSLTRRPGSSGQNVRKSGG